MCMETVTAEKMEKILEELRKPFHPSHVTWKPGKVASTSDKAQALAYADLRAYQNRLDEVCGPNWAVSYTPWGDRLVCNLTIMGITRSSTGEPDSDSERWEIAGTTTEAQAFKRACAMFGLGRYLYNLPAVWAEFDPQRKQFTEQGKAKLAGILTAHYKRFLESEAAASGTITNGNGVAHAATNGTGNHSNGTSSNGTVAKASVQETTVQMADVQMADNGDANLEELHSQLEELGRDLYGDQWDQVCRRNVQRVSGGKAKESRELNAEQVQKLIAGMMKLKSKREVA